MCKWKYWFILCAFSLTNFMSIWVSEKEKQLLSICNGYGKPAAFYLEAQFKEVAHAKNWPGEIKMRAFPFLVSYSKWITESSELEGTHKDQQSPLPARLDLLYE